MRFAECETSPLCVSRRPRFTDEARSYLQSTKDALRGLRDGDYARPERVSRPARLQPAKRGPRGDGRVPPVPRTSARSNNRNHPPPASMQAVRGRSTLPRSGRPAVPVTGVWPGAAARSAQLPPAAVMSRNVGTKPSAPTPAAPQLPVTSVHDAKSSSHTSTSDAPTINDAKSSSHTSTSDAPTINVVSGDLPGDAPTTGSSTTGPPGRLEGTTAYLAPEVVLGGDVTVASDAWALGYVNATT